MCSVLKVGSPPVTDARSALLNSGYKVSQWLGDKHAFKTNAPYNVMWGMVVAHAKRYIETHQKEEESNATEDSNRLFKRDIVFAKNFPTEFDFSTHPNALLSSRQTGVSKFPQNAMPNWGPGSLPSKVAKKDRKRNSGSDSEVSCKEPKVE
ncbi:hypothetical protein RCL1_008462 [Eukaryota sp. TZLM3-RCL]